MVRRAPLVLVFLALFSTLSAAPVPLSGPGLPRVLPTPPLAPRTLRVLRVMDARFPELPEATWIAARAHLPVLLHDLYNLDATITDLGKVTPRAYFERLGIATAAPAGSLRDALLPPAADRGKFVERIGRTISGDPPEKVAGYLPPGAARSLSRSDLAEAICRTYESRGGAILDGRGGVLAGLDPPSYAIVTMAPWGQALRHAEAPEVVITNVPVMYTWRDGTALHALVRGGLIGGFATFSGASRYHGGALITTYPLMAASPAVREVGGETGDPRATARATAALMAHELSHLMFHVGDNYTHDACLMHPPPGLDYHRHWFVAHPVQPCRICNTDARIHEFTVLAGELARAGRFDEAVNAYGRAVAAAPGRAELQNEAAWFCAERAIGLESALAWARAAVKTAPRSPHILDTLGWVEALSGRPRDAVDHLARARDLSAEAREHDRGEITFHLGMALMASGRFAEGALAVREAFSQGHRMPFWKPAQALWDGLGRLLGEGQRYF